MQENPLFYLFLKLVQIFLLFSDTAYIVYLDNKMLNCNINKKKRGNNNDNTLGTPTQQILSILFNSIVS